MLNIGTGGVPLTTKDRSSQKGIARLVELGLKHMEMEFVQGVRMKEETAGEIKLLAEKNDITLTIHGPYYINMATSEPDKLASSLRHISESVRIGQVAGAKSVTFHPAFYQKLGKEEAYAKVKTAFAALYNKMQGEDYSAIKTGQIHVAPELTGKPSQLGDLTELTQLAKDFKEFDQRLCIDFAHNFARSNGGYNTEGDFRAMFDQVASTNGEGFLRDLHMHVSGIIHSEKGERHHVTFLSSLDEYADMGVSVEGIDKHFEEQISKGKNGGSAFNWQGLMAVIKEYKVGGYLVCESPVLELDALLLQRVYER